MADGVPVHLAAGASAASSATVTVAIPAGGIPAGSDLLIAAGSASANLAVSAADNSGHSNVYTLDKATAHSTSITANLLRCHAPTLSPGDVITITFAAAGAFEKWADIYTITGLAPDPVDQTGAANGFSSTPAAAAAGATGQADELVFAVLGYLNASDIFTAGAGYAKLTDQNPASTERTVSEYQVVSAEATYTANGSFTASVGWAMVVGTYKLAVARTFVPKILQYG